MESESEVILSLDPNGNFIIKIVIDNRRSRWVISFAISTVAARWPIPGDGMKTSSVCFITNQRLLQREKYWMRWGLCGGVTHTCGWSGYKRPFNSLGGRGTDVMALWFSLFSPTCRFCMIHGWPLLKFEATMDSFKISV